MQRVLTSGNTKLSRSADSSVRALAKAWSTPSFETSADSSWNQERTLNWQSSPRSDSHLPSLWETILLNRAPSALLPSQTLLMRSIISSYGVTRHLDRPSVVANSRPKASQGCLSLYSSR